MSKRYRWIPGVVGTSIVLAVVFGGIWRGHASEQVTKPSIFRRDNLVAWCIVPFDAAKRTPEQRAQMLKGLGISKLAYDWRAPDVPHFEDEIRSLRRAGIEYFAFWSPATKSPGYRSMLQLLQKYKLHPQIWMIAPSQEAPTEAERVERNARAMLPFLNDAQRLGSEFALYNHGGWSGQPDHLISMVRWLRKHGNTKNVGIVYNFHHGHEHLALFPEAFRRMEPYLVCVNLNGMTPGGPMILPLGQGQKDLEILTMIRASGYRGPIGILDHRPKVDAKKSLRQNLDGLKKLLGQLGDRDALRSFK